MAPSRRNILTGALSFGGGLAAFGGLRPLVRLASATTQPNLADKYYIFCYFAGGWDVLLGLDPRDPDLFTPEKRLETGIDPGYDRFIGPTLSPVSLGDGVTVGPFYGSMANWIDRTAIVRGMSMDTLTHEAGLRRFLTGKPPSGLLARGSSMNTALAAQLGIEAPIPNLTMNCETYNEDQPAYASALQVKSVDDLLRVLRPGDFDLEPNARARVEELLAHQEACGISQTSPTRLDAYDFRLGARDLVQQNLDELFDFAAGSAEMTDLRARYGFTGTSLATANAAAAMAATAITSGITRCCSITVATSLDTHYDDWWRFHGTRQQAGFDLVAALADDLSSREYQGTGTSWLDHTVIVGFSEFSRTPLINASTGRDHWLGNACFLLGGGIRGGQVIGASSDEGMQPQAIDLTTGALDPAGEIPKPEHVFRALLDDIGVTDDVADLRVEPLRALFS